MEYIIMPQWLTETLGILALTGISLAFIAGAYYIINQNKIDIEKKSKFNFALELFIEKSKLEMQYIDSQLQGIYQNYLKMGGKKTYEQFKHYVERLDIVTIEKLDRHLFDKDDSK